MTRSRGARALARASPRSNRVLKSFIGQGYYGTHTPGVILRNVLENPAWYTAYTPYQPEISQGRLEALVNFQTMVCDLTGMAIANASMLDEATAAAEAMTLCLRVGASASRTLLRRRRRVRRRRSTSCARAPRRSASRSSSARRPRRPRADAFARAAAVSGRERRRARLPRARRRAARATARWSIVAADLLALTLLTPPGEWGADVVVGSTQRFGVPMGFGGPHAGYLATRDEFKRIDAGPPRRRHRRRHGKPAYRLALQTREQHIRREKATSNICTAQVLLAVIAGMYAVYHGPDGPRDASRGACTGSTAILQAGLEQLGFAVADRARSSTRSPSRPARATAAHPRARRRARHQLPPRSTRATLGISLDETTTRDDVARIWRVVRRRRRAVHASRDLDARRRRRAARRRSRARRRSSRTRCSTAITPRPRCCATCAGSPTRTSRSTAR